MLSSETFPLNVRIILSDYFSDGSSYFLCVCNHYRRMNQNRLTIILTSTVSCLSDDFLLIAFLFFDLLELLSLDELDCFYDESGNDGSGSGSPGTCAFPFCSGKSVGSLGKSVGSVHGVGSGVFVLAGIESIGDIVPFLLFVPR